MEGKVAVLGDADFVMPFSALGVDTYAVEQERAQIFSVHLWKRGVDPQKFDLYVLAGGLNALRGNT